MTEFAQGQNTEMIPQAGAWKGKTSNDRRGGAMRSRNIQCHGKSFQKKAGERWQMLSPKKTKSRKMRSEKASLGMNIRGAGIQRCGGESARCETRGGDGSEGRKWKDLGSNSTSAS